MPNNPELMSQLMNSPIMQNMMNDPELMRNMLAQNPMVSQVRNFSNLFIHYWCKLDICAVQLPVLTLMHTAVFLQIMERNPQWNLFTQGCPGGESIAAVSARCDSFIAKMERMATGRTVVAFTHGHFSRILTARMLGLPAAAGSVFYNETATVGVLDHRRGELVLTGWNIAGE